MQNDDDTDLFAAEMSGVERIKQNRAHLKKVESDTPGKVVRRSLAVSAKQALDPLASTVVPELKAADVLEYRKDGVQHGVYKNLRMGRYDIEARLDLHRLTVEEARREVFQFLRDCFQYELRTVLILHGKGERNADKIAAIKSHLSVWLPQIDEVMAFHSAQPRHGGTGAVYVMLKKGDKSKQSTREKFGLR
ncbi:MULTISPECIES: DNA endonuclease SmrA [unclassified Oleiphilus]|uniref:DNA endonuclease SmrA n=2 Tax=Oleiphilus TaxID=141450 RepID=UPI0007C24F1D|nr:MULTISPECIES: DNA endonuclease SmrA [unclassified Oleiphilus]KZY63831.1 DNA mismatch repair protein MutS [Oleiphilus sp. HI0066]KZY69249.1 DNA mismatch repair protein MutS [Oleiphilus sp. HI0067]KZZ61400.1 DNA mismatch repair protein MutS [Oleiphilus sp. HI0125]